MSKTVLYLRTDISDRELIAGGSVSHTVGVIGGFLKLGHSVVCASSTMNKVLEEFPLHEHIRLANPQMLKVLRWKLNCLLSNVFFTVQVLRLLKRQTVQFIYQRYSLLNATGVLVSKVQGIPLILEYNGSEVWVDQHWVKGRGPKLRWLIGLVERINIRYADHIVVVSHVLKDELLARGVKEHKILVNPNGVDTDIYDPEKLAPERERIRKALGIEDAFVFGFIGTFSYWHGIEIIAQMIPEVVRKNPRVHFLLIGDGPLRGYFEQEVQRAAMTRHVTCTGLLPSQYARHYLAACDAFLCPTQPNPDGSRFFGSPTKLFEYMSMGKPVIASDMEQLAHIIRSAGTSTTTLLVEPTSLHGFVQVAHVVAALDSQARSLIGNNLRNEVARSFNWEQHALRIMKVYHSCNTKPSMVQ